MILHRFIYLILIFPFFLSCNNESGNAHKLLQSAENIVEQFPDSALLLLDSIQNPYKLNQEIQAKYWLLSVQAKNKLDKDISNDTLIFKAIAFFKKTDDLNRLALATFYSGRVLESQQKPQEALTAFLNAESIAIEAKDSSLAGFIQYNIGYVYYQKGLYDESILKFKQASENFAKQQNDYKKEIMAINYIGTNFAVKKNIDSAFFYFNSALSKAINYNDSTERAMVLLNMGAAHVEFGEPNEAKAKLFEAQQYSKGSIQQAKISLNLANVYAATNRLDSAVFYISHSMDIAQKTEDKVFQASVWYYFSQIDEKRGEFKASLEDYRKYTELLSTIYNERKEANYLDVQKKYEFERIKNVNNKLVIEKLWISIFTIIVITGISFVFYRNRIKNKEALLIAKKQIYELKEMLNKKVETKNGSSDDSNIEINIKLRDTLFQQLNIFKEISLMDSQLQEEDRVKGKKILEKVNKILYNSTNSFDWRIFYQSVNTLHDNYLINLKNKFPLLNNEDLLICCLSKLDFNNKEIALLIASNQNIVQKKKSAIKDKIGTESQGNFITLLDEIIKKHNDSMKTDNHSQ